MPIGWIGDPRLVKNRAFLIAAVFAIAVFVIVFRIRDDNNPNQSSRLTKWGHFAVSLVMHRATLFGLMRRLLRNV